MLLLIVLMAFVCVTIKVLGIPIVLDFAQFVIFVFIGLIISGTINLIFKRKTKQIMMSRKDIELKDGNNYEDDFLFIFTATDILNGLAMLSWLLYGIFACIFMYSVSIFAEYKPICILIPALLVIVIELILFISCYYSTKKNLEHTISLMMYIEASCVNKLILLAAIFGFVVLWFSIVFILVCLVIISFGSKLGG